MAKTQDEIDRIHADRTAITGKIYIGPNNVYYSGSRIGHLIQESTLAGNITGTTLRSVVSNIGDYTTEEVVTILALVADKLDTSTFDLYVAEAKCFTVAMAVAL